MRILVVVGSITTFFVSFFLFFPVAYSTLDLRQFSQVALAIFWLEGTSYMGFLGISISLILIAPFLITRKREVKTVTAGLLFDDVVELSKQLNINKPPKILLENSENLDCFVYGITARGARILISKGLVNLLEQNELKAVILHELSHIKNRDMGLATWGVYFKSAIKYWFVAHLSLIVVSILIQWLIGESFTDPLVVFHSIIFYLIAIVLVPIFTINSSLRNRELLADARVALHTNLKNSLVSAINKVEFKKTLKAMTAPMQKEKSERDNMTSKIGWKFSASHPLFTRLSRTRPSPFDRHIAILDEEFVQSGEKIRLPTKESCTYTGILGFYGIVGGMTLAVLPGYWISLQETVSSFIIYLAQIWGVIVFLALCPLLFFLPNYFAIKNWDANLFRKLPDKEQRKYLFGLLHRNLLSCVSFTGFFYSFFLLPPISISWESLSVLVMAILYFLVSAFLSFSYLLLKLRKKKEKLG